MQLRKALLHSFSLADVHELELSAPQPGLLKVAFSRQSPQFSCQASLSDDFIGAGKVI